MPPQQANPSSGIKWHEVTWYSKLGAILLFVGVVPALSFYTGMKYDATQQILNTQASPTHTQNIQPKSSTPSPPQTFTKFATIATSSLSGFPATIVIERCAHDIGSCFGSGRFNPTTRGTITVFDLISKDDPNSNVCAMRYGVISSNHQGKEDFYNVFVDVSKNCSSLKSGDDFRNEILNGALGI